MTWVITPQLKSTEGVRWDDIPADRKFSPANITTALWLDAADASTVTTVSSAVSEWRDKSGNSIHVSQSTSTLRPAYVNAGLNNRNTIGAAGIYPDRQRLTNTSAALFRNASQMSGFIVGRKPNNIASDQIFVQVVTTVPNGRFAIAKIGSSNVIATIARRLAANSIARADGTSVQASYAIIGGTVDFSVTTGETWINGVREGLNTSFQSAGSTENNAGELSIFMDLNATFADSVTDIGEIILLNRVPSTVERQKIEGYLAHKWGLTGNLPNDHPYKANVPPP